MQEGDLRRDEDDSSSTDLSGTSGTAAGDGLSTSFRVEEGVTSGDLSDPSLKELLKNSESVSKEIDSVLSSTESSDGSFNMLPGLAKGRSSDSTATGPEVFSFKKSDSSVGASAAASGGSEVAKLAVKVKSLAEERKLQKETITRQRAQIAELSASQKALRERLRDLTRMATQEPVRSGESDEATGERLQGALRELVLSKAGQSSDNELKLARQELEGVREELRVLKESGGASTAESLELAARVDDEKQRRLAAEKDALEARASVKVHLEQVEMLQQQVSSLLQSNQKQSVTIESQQTELTRLSLAPRSASSAGSARGMDDFNVGQLESSLAQMQEEYAGQVTPPSVRSVASEHHSAHTGSDVSGEESSEQSKDEEIHSLRSAVARRDRELATLREAMVKLESGLASIEKPPSRSAESYSSNGEDSDTTLKLRAQVQLLTSTTEEQRRTLDLQGNVIGALKEELRLRTHQVEDFQDDNVVNVEKQRRVASQLQEEQRRVASQRAKLDKDIAQFRLHLRAFKAQRRELLGGAVVATVQGVPKDRYRITRDKRDKYKRKTYRAERAAYKMEKRLLQHVELLEVEDSQGGDSEGSYSSEYTSDTTHSSYTHSTSTAGGNASSQSIQLVQDESSSEHGTERSE